MKVVRAVPTETISEKLSVQRLSEALLCGSGSSGGGHAEVAG